MRYIATITIPGEAAPLFSGKDFSSDRVHVTHEEAQGEMRFTITAQDSVALRAVCNSITKLLTVWEKTHTL